jgi:hypothetical protein
LQALQHLVSRITSRQTREKFNVSIDVSGYRERRAESLKARAEDLADQVFRTGREVKTEPLSAPDRRVIHRALADAKGVETQAIGDGATKPIVIRATGDVGDRRGREDSPSRRQGGGRERGPRRREERGDRPPRRGGRDRPPRSSQPGASAPRRREEPSRDVDRVVGPAESVVNTSKAPREEPLDLSDPFKRVSKEGEEDAPETASGDEGRERTGLRSRRRRPYKRRLI